MDRRNLRLRVSKRKVFRNDRKKEKLRQKELLVYEYGLLSIPV
jgi:hypothetical protein